MQLWKYPIDLFQQSFLAIFICKNEAYLSNFSKQSIFSLHTHSVWETTVMHKEVSGWTVNFGPNFPESPFLELKTRISPPPSPFRKTSDLGWPKFTPEYPTPQENCQRVQVRDVNLRKLECRVRCRQYGNMTMQGCVLNRDQVFKIRYCIHGVVYLNERFYTECSFRTGSRHTHTLTHTSKPPPPTHTH